MTAPFIALFFCAKTEKLHVFGMERSFNNQYLRVLIVCICHLLPFQKPGLKRQ